MNELQFLNNQAQIIQNLYNSNKHEEVVRKGEQLIKKYPSQILFYNITALSLSTIGKSEMALNILNKALMYDTKNIFVLNNLGLINSNLNKFKTAREYYEKALDINENFVDALVNLANLDIKENKTGEAKKNLEKALRNNKNPLADQIIYSALGFYFQQIGDFSNAIKNFEILNKINPNNDVSDKAISLIHKYKNIDDPHLKSMEEKILKKKDDIKLNFALGKAYEDLKDYKKSFYYIDYANSLANKKYNYKIDSDEKLFIQIKNFSSNIKNLPKIAANKKIIFVVGMPRSGTTLTEQILSSHDKVYGAGELPYVEEVIKKYLYKNNSFIQLSINDLKIETIQSMQKDYMEKIETFNIKEEYIVDKAPLNFRWIGIIKNIFPNSKIIHLVRDPMDTCLSNFKNNFVSRSIAYCYNLKTLGKYYRLYKDLMEFWKKKLPEEIYNLSYEKLIENQISETQKLLKFCNLSWDENCLKPHENKKIVSTASLEQIRKPIYSDSVQKWKKYENELSELKKIIYED